MIRTKSKRRAARAAIVTLVVLSLGLTACDEKAPWEVGKPWGGAAAATR